MIEREELRALVRTRYDFQHMRITMANRLKMRKDETPQDESDPAELDEDTMPVLKEVYEEAKATERKLEREIAKVLKGVPIWEGFLKDVKGIGPCMAGVIISEYDIHIASTVSKLWQFTGLNPGQVRGTTRKDKKVDGKRVPVFEKSDVMVRGDRRSPGFVSPFNGWLRSKMIGVLAGSFIKAQAPYAMEFYYPYKARLEQEANLVEGAKDPKAWSEESKGHRDNAAKRYMIKMFLKDLYVAWRAIEGLYVRPPYSEEYLGKRHAS